MPHHNKTSLTNTPHLVQTDRGIPHFIPSVSAACDKCKHAYLIWIQTRSVCETLMPSIHPSFEKHDPDI